jgi:hypothetical protein
MLPDGFVASGEMLPAIAPATVLSPILRRGYGHQDDVRGAAELTNLARRRYCFASGAEKRKILAGNIAGEASGNKIT